MAIKKTSVRSTSKAVKSTKGKATAKTVKTAKPKAKATPKVKQVKSNKPVKAKTVKVTKANGKPKKPVAKKKTTEKAEYMTHLTPHELKNYKKVKAELSSSTLRRLEPKQKENVLNKEGFKSNDDYFGVKKEFRIYPIDFVKIDKKVLETSKILAEKIVLKVERDFKTEVNLNKLASTRFLKQVIRLHGEGFTEGKLAKIGNLKTKSAQKAITDYKYGQQVLNWL